MAAQILVVEDERNIRVLVSAVLRQKGCEVVEATNGLDALHHIERDARFDAIVTDLKMPQVNGITLVQEIKARHPQIPIVVMSAYMAEDWTRDFNRHDLISLPKPFTHTQLVQTLDRVLQQ